MRTRRAGERGASALEYGLLIAGIAVIVLAAVLVFGHRVGAKLADDCDSIVAATGQSACS